jgi:hypothetical protein
MTEKFYNITAGYALADLAIKKIYEIEEELLYFEDAIEYNSPNFLEKIHKPNKSTLLHEFLRNEEFSIEEWIFRKTELPLEVNRYRHYLKFANLEIPGWLNETDVEENKEDL